MFLDAETFAVEMVSVNCFFLALAHKDLMVLMRCFCGEFSAGFMNLFSIDLKYSSVSRKSLRILRNF